MAKQVDTTYGNALFELAVEENMLDSLYEEVNELVLILKITRSLSDYLIIHRLKNQKRRTLSREFLVREFLTRLPVL